MTYEVFVQKNMARTISLPATGFAGTPTFLAKSGSNVAYQPFPGATVTVADGYANVDIPAGDYYPRYFRLTDSGKTIDGRINWTSPRSDNPSVTLSQLTFDPATQTELDTVATAKENTGVAQTLVDAARLRATNTQTAAYTLALADLGKAVEINSGVAVTLTVPTNAAVAFPIGTVIFVRQPGAGAVSVAPATGATIVSAGGARRISAQWGEATLTKRGIDEWVLSGNIAV